MKKRMRKGSMTIETALLLPLFLLVIFGVLYLFFYVHNRAWLTAAAYEAALDGSMEAYRPKGECSEKALQKGRELGNTGFFGSENLKVQTKAGKKVRVIYDLDTISVYGGFNGHLQIKGEAKVLKMVSWIRKLKGVTEVWKGK